MEFDQEGVTTVTINGRYSNGTAYYMKDNLLFRPNDAVGGMCGLHFFILVPQE